MQEAYFTTSEFLEDFEIDEDEEDEIIEEEEVEKEKKLILPNKFSIQVEEYRTANECGYIEAVIGVCTDNGYDPEEIVPAINRSLKDKIEFEAGTLNLLKEKPTEVQLPI